VTDCLEYSAGETPLLISIPHDGRRLPPELAKRMTARAREIPDTDWHVGRLYEFAADLGAGIIAANYSRYVIDLNRPESDESLYEGRFVTGLCPDKLFDGEDIYLAGAAVSAEEKTERIDRYWRPYHEKIASVLDQIREDFGYALLWDAHSIPSRVPLLFDDELPVLNFGTNAGSSCAKELVDVVMQISNESDDYSKVLDGRFKGGYITRHYGDPENNIHAIQLELAQRAYMNEKTLDFDTELAPRLQKLLSTALQAFLLRAASKYEEDVR
jgi:N-formylglutamate deformylase